MKKYIYWAISFLCLVGIIYYLLSVDIKTEMEASSEVSNTSFEAKKSQTNHSQTKDSIQSKKISNSKIDVEELEKINEYLDRVEIDWYNEIENLFLSDAKSGESFIQEYRELKRGYEEERERRYEEFHARMRKEHGPNYSYSPSIDEEMFNEKLVKAYELELSKIIGEKLMIEYMSLKDSFNEKQKKSKKTEDDFFTSIEF